MTEPRGIRNNNPGNIINNGIQWVGLAENQTDPIYYQFVEAVFGVRAMVLILYAYKRNHGLNTVREIITRWAPPIENDTESYIASVSFALGVNSNDIIDVENDEIMIALLKSIVKHENGYNPYNTKLFEDAISLARGIEPAPISDSTIGIEPRILPTIEIIGEKPLDIAAILFAIVTGLASVYLITK